MSLPTDIIHSNRRLRELAHHLSGYLNALERLLPPGEQARQAFINARATVGFIHAECTQLEMNVGHEQRHGALPRMVEPNDLELHPANLPAQPQDELWTPIQEVHGKIVSGHLRSKMLASLDRVKDDTFKEEEGAE